MNVMLGSFVMSGLKSWCCDSDNIGWSDVLLQTSHHSHASTTSSYVCVSLVMCMWLFSRPRPRIFSQDPRSKLYFFQIKTETSLSWPIPR